MPQPKVLEATVKLEVKKRLNKMGAYHHWPVQMGMGDACLDCHGCYRGVYFSIETKKPGGALTPRQRITIGKIRAAGGLVFVIDGTDEHPYEQLDRIKVYQAVIGPLEAYREPVAGGTDAGA